jgi:KDO2-lipid IV(A) lauroyltransferase
MKNPKSVDLKVKLMSLATLLQISLPRWFMVWLATLLGNLFFLIEKNRRNLIYENMNHILGSKATAQKKKRYTRQLFINYSICMADLLRAPLLTKEKLLSMVEFQGIENFDKALAKGEGAVLITAHIGNWDLAGVYMSHLGYKLIAVVEPIPKGVSAAMNRYRGLGGMELVPLTDKDIMNQVLVQKKVLVLLADRDLTGRGFELTFFDAKRYFPKGPAALALKYKVPLVFGYFILDKGKPYKGVIEPEIIYKETGEFYQDVNNLTELIVQRINRLVAEHPDQWFVFKADWR